MSGGSMDYLYQRVRDAEFRADTPERRAFSQHLGLVAEALKAIEWVDSGDWAPGDENEAIAACVTPFMSADMAIQTIKDIRKHLADVLVKHER